MGNMRSPSRDPEARAKAAVLTAEERDVQEKWEEEHNYDRVSSGRGGMGNVATVKLQDAVQMAKDEGVTED